MRKEPSDKPDINVTEKTETMTINDTPELWPTLLLLFLLAIAVFSAMMATTRADRLNEEAGDLHRVIDMDAVKLKEKDAVIAKQREKIDRLMKIRRK